MPTFTIDDITVHLFSKHTPIRNQDATNIIYMNISSPYLSCDCASISCEQCPFGSDCVSLLTANVLDKYLPGFVEAHPEYFI